MTESTLREALEEAEHTLLHIQDNTGSQFAAIPRTVELIRRALSSTANAEMVPTLDIKSVLHSVNRRDHLFKNSPVCPACQDAQVQCTDYLVVPSEWKCRMCKHRFVYEPPATPDHIANGGKKVSADIQDRRKGERRTVNNDAHSFSQLKRSGSDRRNQEQPG